MGIKVRKLGIINHPGPELAMQSYYIQGTGPPLLRKEGKLTHINAPAFHFAFLFNFQFKCTTVMQIFPSTTCSPAGRLNR